MTDYMTISSMMTTVGYAPKREYKVRAIRADGTQANLVGGWGSTFFRLAEEVFSSGADIEDRLIPSVEVENQKVVVPSRRIVKLEAYYTKEHTVAEMDLEVEDSKVTTEATNWVYVPYSD